MDLAVVMRSFKKQKVVTIIQLADWLSCSVVTARRRLKAWRAYTSYNHNGRYYTLPEIAQFDGVGLWRHQGAFFSKHGNLKQTLVHLVTQSEQGLSGAELGEILGLQPRSFLSHFRDHPAIYREKMTGHWIWFSADSGTRKQQMQTRLDERNARQSLMPSDMEAVMILVDLIWHPESDVEQIARRLKSKDLNIGVTAIRQLLDHHGLLKKTAAIPASDA
jgi:hypothetical protein